MKKYLTLVCGIGALLIPAFASAATLSFVTLQTSVGVGEPFDVEIVLYTKNAVNAVGAAIAIPPGFDVVRTSNGNAVVNFWVEQPNYDPEARTLAFSGIVPSGFSGTGRLLMLTLKADKEGSAVLSFDRTHTVVYQNGPDGTEEPTTLQSLTFNVEAGLTPLS